MPQIKRATPPGMVRTFRAWSGQTQAGLAESLGITPQTVSAYERHGGPAWLCHALYGLAAAADELPAPAPARPAVPLPALDLMRHVRRSLELTQAELGAALGIGEQTVRHYEHHGAPTWMPFALIGLGSVEHGVPVREMIRRVGLACAERARYVEAPDARHERPA